VKHSTGSLDQCTHSLRTAAPITGAAVSFPPKGFSAASSYDARIYVGEGEDPRMSRSPWNLVAAVRVV
jgi:hypothetical protein